MEILLVDDEVEILEMLKRHLEFEGFKVVTTSDPIEAEKLMAEHLFRLAVTDIRMPGMTGIELLQKFKALNPLANVFIMTGYSNMSYVVECLSNGAYDYFTKPFNDLDGILATLKDGWKRVKRWEGAMQFNDDSSNG